MKSEFTPGTVISGTMRLQDLIPEFLDLINQTPEYEQMIANDSAIPAYVFDEGDDSNWWSTDEAWYLLDELFDILDSYAPDGHYFGAHHGDGSDYGFWPVESEGE